MANWRKRFFDPTDWYWTVGSDTTRVYSSAQRKYVLVSDPTYTTWLTVDRFASHADTEDDLWLLLNERNPSGLPLVFVPKSVTMRQARLVLLHFGMLDGVEPMISSLPSPIKEMAQIEWEYSSVVERDKTLVRMLAQSLNLDAMALDNLFLAASKL